ncbi:hypothetical protein ACQJBY_050581 [Aegilops geniculata]
MRRRQGTSGVAFANLFKDKFGGRFVETTGWSFVYLLVVQHEPCTREDSGVYLMYVVHYILEFTDLYFRSTMNQEQIDHLREKIAYEIVTIKGNKGDIPEFLSEDILNRSEVVVHSMCSPARSFGCACACQLKCPDLVAGAYCSTNTYHLVDE